MKKTWIAVLLSFFLPGFGHFYLGKVKKGFILLSSYLLSSLLLTLLIGIIPLMFIWIYSMLDSYKLVDAVNSEINQTRIT
ncbi:DUF6677 family protein [Paenibacillus bouchesdurhonensis]|uniref:DUF6677 family protein n=1 Tax=Paenibacillus bouchesdurhonensis TaxID=1870990 RepID=UPI000DA6262C|nr:DUF6677 family protein [Paenibacillus bouchesdurhonensis]